MKLNGPLFVVGVSARRDTSDPLNESLAKCFRPRGEKMKKHLHGSFFAAVLAFCLHANLDSASGNGLLIPVEPDVAPLAMLNHRVTVKLEDQVAVTNVRQTFRNHTAQALEATYVFPVPRGASVREFATWVNGKKVKGELLKADRAKKIYTNIVRQTKDPGLLEYIGTDVLSLKIFPVPANGEQTVEVSFTAVASKELDVVK